MDEYKNLAELLNKNKEGIPRARRFRDNLTKIESILSTGIRIRYLVECLNKNDFEITMKAFKEELHKARKKLKQQVDTPVPKITNAVNKKSNINFSNDEKENPEKNNLISPPKRRMTLREIQEETEREERENKRPLF